jgi:hypothetical protein
MAVHLRPVPDQAPYMDAVTLYTKALQIAEQNLARWRRLGKLRGRTSDPKWQRELRLRQDDVKLLQLLLWLAEQEP